MQATIHVRGIVQGVGFRPFIYTIAKKNCLSGFVQNLGDAGVKIVVEGESNQIKTFLEQIKKEKPPLAKIEDIQIQWDKKKGSHKKFEIKKSLKQSIGEGSSIPPDVSICQDCLHEITDTKNRRYEYFFITCTNCGPRYTIIQNLPYDRPNTTMKQFPLCVSCNHEYTNPINRRYHAQTIACYDCGPQIYLTVGKKMIQGSDAIKQAAQLIDTGEIVAIKGNGGFHLSCTISNQESVKKLRQLLGRQEKPFAIMAQDIPTVETLVDMSSDEKQLLISPMRPIVVLNKKITGHDLSLIAPNLHNIGIMLPYTGLHQMLFKYSTMKAFVMTSANIPGEPIIYENTKMQEFTNYVLYYDREIFQRCDDSVIRFINKTPVFLRRSRGYVPLPIPLKFTAPDIIAFGPELDVVSCLLTGNKAFLSQFIGNTKRYDTLRFLEDATKHLINITNINPEGIACDLHPQFNTTKLAKKWSENLQIPMVQVQHHHAHLASVMAEHKMDMENEIIGIDADGAGYGDDGTIWGGEIFHCSFSKYHRIGHLQQQPMLGGDLATRYPLRMIVGILINKIDEKILRKWLSDHAKKFPYGKKEIEIILKQGEKTNNPLTSSCGRILDAIAALLDICWERTYEGEPAMKLESCAEKGKNTLKLKPRFLNDSIIDTAYLIEQIWKNKHVAKKDLAHSAHSYLAQGLAQLAIRKAKNLGISTIGFSGGCAYNNQLTSEIQKEIETNGLNFIRNRYLPPGDGGVALGQAVVASTEII